MPETETPNVEPTPEVEPQEEPQGTPEGEETPDGADALGDAGKKALDSMKGKWKEERDKRRDLERRIAELETPKGESPDDQPDAKQIKAQATREANAKANARILRSEIKAAAAGKFADPADALAFIDASKFEVDENGDVDADEISDAIEDLLTRKPHLAATARQRFQGTGDGGAQRKVGPSQLSREDLKGMSPAAIHKAKAEGRLNQLLGITK